MGIPDATIENLELNLCTLDGLKRGLYCDEELRDIGITLLGPRKALLAMKLKSLPSTSLGLLLILCCCFMLFYVVVLCCCLMLLSYVVVLCCCLMLLSYVVVVLCCCCLMLLLSYVVVVLCCCCYCRCRCCLMLLSYVVVVVILCCCLLLFSLRKKGSAEVDLVQAIKDLKLNVGAIAGGGVPSLVTSYAAAFEEHNQSDRRSEIKRPEVQFSTKYCKAWGRWKKMVEEWKVTTLFFNIFSCFLLTHVSRYGRPISQEQMKSSCRST